MSIVISIALAGLSGIFLLLHGATSQPLIRFDPLDCVSLITAASAGDLQLEKAAARGACASDEEAATTQVSLMSVDGNYALVKGRI